MRQDSRCNEGADPGRLRPAVLPPEEILGNVRRNPDALRRLLNDDYVRPALAPPRLPWYRRLWAWLTGRR